MMSVVESKPAGEERNKLSGGIECPEDAILPQAPFNQLDMDGALRKNKINWPLARSDRHLLVLSDR
jgi:hypothetical protein